MCMVILFLQFLAYRPLILLTSLLEDLVELLLSCLYFCSLNYSQMWYRLAEALLGFSFEDICGHLCIALSR